MRYALSRCSGTFKKNIATFLGLRYGKMTVIGNCSLTSTCLDISALCLASGLKLGEWSCCTAV